MSFQLENSNYQNFFDKIQFNVDVPFNNSIKPPFENSSFFYIICGQPGSGKTSFLINLLKQHKNPKNNIYYKVFDKILLVMPSNSRASIQNNIFNTLPPEQIFDEIDINLFESIKVIKELFDENKEEAKIKKKKYTTQHQLLILDDITAQLKNNDVEKMLVELALNRRHLNLSIILLVQVLNKIPKSVRSNCTSLIFFNTKAKAQLQIIHEEFILLDKKSFENLIKFCFDKQHNFIFINKDGFFYKNLQKINFPD